MESIKKKIENCLDHLPVDYSVHPAVLGMLRAAATLQIITAVT
jgi:hypothetical protein